MITSYIIKLLYEPLFRGRPNYCNKFGRSVLSLSWCSPLRCAPTGVHCSAVRPLWCALSVSLYSALSCVLPVRVLRGLVCLLRFFLVSSRVRAPLATAVYSCARSCSVLYFAPLLSFRSLRVPFSPFPFLLLFIPFYSAFYKSIVKS